MDENQTRESDRQYAEKLAEHDAWPIGDTDQSAGTLQPDDDVDTGVTGGDANLAAALQSSGPGGDQPALRGTDDLGAALGPDLGPGLGATRGSGGQHPRGQITGVGGTRGSGAGTGHLEDTPS